MTMPCSIAGDMSIGHAGFSPASITPSTSDVLVMGTPPHVLGQAVHGGTVQDVSTTVMTAKGVKGIARLMDKGDCGSLILGTGATVMVGG